MMWQTHAYHTTYTHKNVSRASRTDTNYLSQRNSPQCKTVNRDEMLHQWNDASTQHQSVNGLIDTWADYTIEDVQRCESARFPVKWPDLHGVGARTDVEIPKRFYRNAFSKRLGDDCRYLVAPCGTVTEPIPRANVASIRVYPYRH